MGDRNVKLIDSPLKGVKKVRLSQVMTPKGHRRSPSALETLRAMEHRISLLQHLGEEATEEELMQAIDSTKRIQVSLLGMSNESHAKRALLEQCAVFLRGYITVLVRKRKAEEDSKERMSQAEVEAATLAESQNSAASKTINERLVSINRWGQVRSTEGDEPPPDEHLSQKEKTQARKRERKWLEMNKTWAQFTRKHPAVVKRRVRKGIPDSLRGTMWVTLTGSRQWRDSQPDAYTELCTRESPFAAVIRRDIGRTFPEQAFFTKDGSRGLNGRESLFNVLSAYSIQDPEVGYCQGMAFLVGMFLMYVDEEEAFWMLQSVLVSKLNLAGLWCPSFPLLYQFFHVLQRLLHEHCPRVLVHLEDNMVQLNVFATEWFLTLFAAVLPFETTLRIWDVMFAEGVRIIFKVAVFLIKNREKELAEGEFEDLMVAVKELPKGMTTEAIMNGALAMPITTATIEAHMRGYVDTEDIGDKDRHWLHY